jgi:hypothetical protein
LTHATSAQHILIGFRMTSMGSLLQRPPGCWPPAQLLYSAPLLGANLQARKSSSMRVSDEDSARSRRLL